MAFGGTSQSGKELEYHCSMMRGLGHSAQALAYNRDGGLSCYHTLPDPQGGIWVFSNRGLFHIGEGGTLRHEQPFDGWGCHDAIWWGTPNGADCLFRSWIVAV